MRNNSSELLICHWCKSPINEHKTIYINNKVICNDCLKQALESPLNTQFKQPDLNEDGTYND